VNISKFAIAFTLFIVGIVLIVRGVYGFINSWREFKEHTWSKPMNAGWGIPPGVLRKWVSLILIGMVLLGASFEINF